jgi:hypothetical protein
MVSVDASDTIIAACIFIWTMQVSQNRGLDEKFDPDNVMEDFDCLQKDLLISPQPLLLYASSSVPSVGKDVASNEATPSICPPFGVEDALAPFEEAVRLTMLICLRAATMQARPWSRKVYVILLARLVERLQLILNWMNEDTCNCSFVDPMLLRSQDKRNPLPISSARPFLIWMCMVGYELSIYYGIFHQGWSDHHPKGCIYLKILEAIGIHDTEDIELCSDDDLIIFDTINLNWATETKWKAADMLRWIIR